MELGVMGWKLEWNRGEGGGLVGSVRMDVGIWGRIGVLGVRDGIDWWQLG